MPERRQPKQERAQQTVDVVLQGAVRGLGREGIDSVTTNRIAEAAGVSIGSLYQYFPDKHAIFEALHERHAQRVQQVIARDDLLTQVRRLGHGLRERLVATFGKHPFVGDIRGRGLFQAIELVVRESRPPISTRPSWPGPSLGPLKDPPHHPSQPSGTGLPAGGLAAPRCPPLR